MPRGKVSWKSEDWDVDGRAIGPIFVDGKPLPNPRVPDLPMWCTSREAEEFAAANGYFFEEV